MSSEILDGLDLARVGFNPSVTNQVAEEFARPNTECTFLSIKLQIELLQDPKYLVEVGEMVDLIFAFGDYVIDISLHYPAKQLFKQLGHHPLERSPNVLQSEGHYLITISPLRSDEGYLLLILLIHGNPVVAPVGIHKAESSGTGSGVH